MKVNVKVIVFVFVIVIVQNYGFQGFCFYVKLGLSRLSAVVLPQDANLFEDGEERPLTHPCHTDALHKRCDLLFFFIPLGTK